MSTATRGFRRLLLAKPARDLDHGARIERLFREAGLPIHEFENDTAVLRSPGAPAPGDLLVLTAPEVGWLSPARHGSLAVRPGEHYLHPIIGCRSSCTYCYLQAHPQGRRPLRLHVDVGAFLGAIDGRLSGAAPADVLLCTGELADSVAEIELYPIAAVLVEFVATRERVRLELRTKSDRVGPLLHLRHRRQTTVAFSIVPDALVRAHEPGTAPFERRLRAAERCQAAGYPVALKFEPLFLVPGWRELYDGALRALAARLDPGAVDHVSVGCLRWNDALAANPTFAARHQAALGSPTHRIEYRQGMFNNTPPLPARLGAYRDMRLALRSHGFSAPIWWSMEERALLDAIDGDHPPALP